MGFMEKSLAGALRPVWYSRRPYASGVLCRTVMFAAQQVKAVV